MLLKLSKLFVAVLFMPVVLLVSCTETDLYNQSVAIPDNGWNKEEAVHFDVPIKDTLTDYNFFLNIRNNAEYRYSNLYLFLNTVMPNGNKTRDTIEIILADNDGRWLGKGWGSVKENDILLKKNLRFPLKGSYRFFIQQAMRRDTLIGIINVGLRIAKVAE